MASALDGRDYGSPDYWQQRYEQKDGDTYFEWYAGGEQLVVQAMGRHCGTLGRARTLEVGAGNSRLATLIASAGFGPVLATDIVQGVVAHMASQPDRHPDVSYLQLDACSLDKQLESCSFDVVVDKGCTDALDCGGKTELALAQMHCVLKPGGLLMLVSCRDPEQRLKPDSLLTQRFHLLETVPLPEGPGSPCACAYLYCLRSSTGAEQ